MKNLIQWLHKKKPYQMQKNSELHNQNDTYSLLSEDLTTNQAILTSSLGESEDIQYQPITWGDYAILLVYIDGLVDKEMIQTIVLEPLQNKKLEAISPINLSVWGKHIIKVVDQLESNDINTIRNEILQGKTALLIDGSSSVLLLDMKRLEQRSIETPPMEFGLRGPRDGFVENITTNISLIRRRWCDPNLRVHFFKAGKRSSSRIAMLYVHDIAHDALVHEIRTRLSSLDFDIIIDTNQLRELLYGSGFTLFPVMESTERPDKVVSALLTGKIAIFVDNSPFSVTLPMTFFDSFRTPDDDYTVPLVTWLVRIIRLEGWLISLLLSPLYIAIQMFTPNFLRSDLALYLQQVHSGVPLNAMLEIVFLEMANEIIFEATVRLPSKIGSAATIVGGLIIGQAAVQAHLVSGSVVIITAISLLGSLTLPSETGQIWRSMKWGLIIVASLFGTYGMFAAIMILFSFMVSRDSFGTPYMSPLAPFIPQDLFGFVFFRKPLGNARKRPVMYQVKDQDLTSEKQKNKYMDKGER